MNEFIINEKETNHLSKFLSLVLRHKPERIGIRLDENGWTDVDILMEKMNASGKTITLPILKHVVETNSKKRFMLNEAEDKIRASQGHSVEVDLDYTSQTPPPVLYHGTAAKWVDVILKEGLRKQKRHHVHLSADQDTAINVGQRQGVPFVFEVRALEMSENGFEFFRSDNGVWLTDHVPPVYLTKVDR